MFALVATEVYLKTQHSDLSVTFVYDHFGDLLATMNVCTHLLCAFLCIKVNRVRAAHAWLCVSAGMRGCVCVRACLCVLCACVCVRARVFVCVCGCVFVHMILDNVLQFYGLEYLLISQRIVNNIG